MMKKDLLLITEVGDGHTGDHEAVFLFWCMSEILHKKKSSTSSLYWVPAAVKAWEERRGQGQDCFTQGGCALKCDTDVPTAADGEHCKQRKCICKALA